MIKIDWNRKNDFFSNLSGFSFWTYPVNLQETDKVISA